MKTARFTISFAYSLSILSVIVNISKISRARLHYDVIVTLYEDGWYFLVSMERGDPLLYVGSKHKGEGHSI